MSKNKYKTRVPEQLQIQQAPALKNRETIEVIEKVHQHCPYCKSIRSNLVRTEPGTDGRMETRACKNCHKRFKVWDNVWQKTVESTAKKEGKTE